MMADQHQYDHDHHRAEDHAHDDHRGVGQADQVQPLRSRFGAFSCSRSALLGFGGFLAHGGGGTRSPRLLRPLNGRFGPPNDQFHDKFSRLYGSFGSSIGTSRVSALLSPEYEAIRRRVSAYPALPT
jgi:hypothetical protein